MQIGYTRNHDNPDSDMRGDPTAGQMARFFYTYKAKHDMGGQAVLDENGNPIMVKVLCVEISTAHDSTNKPVMKATEAHKVQYKRFWDAFTRQEDFTSVAGTKLKLLPNLDMIQQFQIQGMSILSIEQLADVHEGILLQHPWLRHWKDQAQGYLIEHKPHPDQKVQDELAELRAQITQLSKAQNSVVETVTVEEKAERDAERAREAASGKPDVMNPKKSPKEKEAA